MAIQKLQVKQTILDGVQYGIKNVASLILMVVLYLITIWIPYLNVGTTIGMYKAIIKIGKGEIINPTAIFNKDNFKTNLGEFFLLMGFMSMGVTAASMFMFIPGIVLGIAWGFAMFFFIDKGLAPHKALKVSYKVTDGEKWTIFWTIVLVALCGSILGAIFMLIPKVGWIFNVLVIIVVAAVMVAVEGVMYKHFSDKADEMFADKACACKAPEAPSSPAAPEAPSAPEAPAE